MGVTFKRGQVWEDECGARIRIVDEKVETRTELYLAPIKLQIEPVGTDLPEDGIEDLSTDDEDKYRMSRDTLLRRCTLIDPESTPQ